MRAFSLILCLCLPFSAFGEFYKPHRSEPASYHGPSTPLRLSAKQEIPIGFFGPNPSSTSKDQGPWLCAQQAIEEINQKKELNGNRLLLLPAWSENPWGAGVSQMARMTYEHNIWAWLGSVNGHATHLAEQVVTKARLPLLDFGSTDDSVNNADVPWALSVLPGDRQIAKALVHTLVKQKRTQMILLSSLDHDSRFLTEEVLKELRKQHLTPTLHLHLNSNHSTTAQVLEQPIRNFVILAKPLEAISFLKSWKTKGSPATFFGGPGFLEESFLRSSQEWDQNFYVPLLTEFTPKQKAFEEAFFKKHGFRADTRSMATYDTIHLLARALLKNPTTHTQLLQLLQNGPDFSGITGRIRWNSFGRNDREVKMGTLRNGKIAPTLL